jgi:hypothetical protein
MIGRNKRMGRGSLFSRGPELTARVPRLLGQDLKPLDLFAVGIAASVTGDAQLPLQSGSWNTRLSDVC